jgi:uncharacterized membrane protein
MDTHLRSVAKGMSWRIIATLVTTIVVWLISGEVSMALFAGASDSLVKIGLYWGHERLWQTVGWGREIPHQLAIYTNKYVIKNSPKNMLVDGSL